jgi:hypothetical protein
LRLTVSESFSLSDRQAGIGAFLFAAHFPFAFSPGSKGCRSAFMAPLLSVPACNLAEFVSRLSAALMNVHDLPAAIRPRSRSFSSDVHRILGTTQSFLRLFAPSSGRHLG